MNQKAPQTALKNMLAEASDALAHLDAARLEEMTLSCAALVREENREGGGGGAGFESEAREGMALFARVLEATKANLKVMRRLREMRSGRFEYGPAQAGCELSEEVEHGDH